MELKNGDVKLKERILRYRTNKYIYDFQQFQRIRFSDDSISRGKITINKAEEDQSYILKYGGI